ncbi:MAG: phosphoglucomutase [Proteobacteria bacterium]|nr:phosphoglucomutase [Pseudomonadota bacterium]MBU1715917.1 phosphoglucomutase [Pseudomonadota bacterium]
MSFSTKNKDLINKYIVPGNHAKSDYFSLIKALVTEKNSCPTESIKREEWQEEIAEVYELIHDELKTNQSKPVNTVKFGTSGWRGMIGKDLFVKSVALVTQAIAEMYIEMPDSGEITEALGVGSLAEARTRGCVIGHDNRFGGPLLARTACDILTANNFKVFYAGEASTGTLSATVLEKKAAFSINLTPSHNPLEYGGFKFNAADAGPAASVITNKITANTKRLMQAAAIPTTPAKPELVTKIDALTCWQAFIRKGKKSHHLDYDEIIDRFANRHDMVVAIDCVHGASRIHIDPLFKNMTNSRLIKLRAEKDYTFGGIAPEPSATNMKSVTAEINKRSEQLKLGVIIDPDADRIRFTDGTIEIDMNQFGAMAYHFLHEIKKLTGLVAKNVATSNFANKLATSFNEEIFESRVGFKEFKPVIDRALVCFEESDGITIIGHTPEKDAYIGLMLAMDMMLTLNKTLGQYLTELEETYGRYYPARDGITVSQQGDELLSTLSALEKYKPGSSLMIGTEKRIIVSVIDIDGRKMILDDGSWLMIRPSGTEPKIRFYVEARREHDKEHLFATARGMLDEIGLLN